MPTKATDRPARTHSEALTKSFLQVHSSTSPRSSMELPAEMGAGFYTQIQLRGGIRIAGVDMTFARPVSLAGITAPDASQCHFLFCFGGSMQWENLESGEEFAVEEAQSCVMNAANASGRSFFQEGGGINGFGVTIPGATLCGLFDNASGGRICRTLREAARPRMGTTDARHKRIIHEILSCRLSGNVRQIYCESKVMELLAIYLDEFFFGNATLCARPDLDARTMDGLKKAKNILDADIAGAPALGALARMAGLNECKLKAGFKKMFGMPVHAYIIDKRLDEARRLLETRRLRVTEAAQMVGYSELGQFAGKFRRKFGITPSELLRIS